MDVEQIYEDYLAALRSGDGKWALNVVRLALVEHVDFRDLYLSVIQPAMYEIGHGWSIGEVTVAQEHQATAITHRVMTLIHNQVTARLTPGRMLVSALGRTMVATCVPGETHDLGLRMVADFFAVEGWHVSYLGANMPIASIVEMVNVQRADVLAISATLHTHVLRARDLIDAVRASPIGLTIKILVGGYVFNQMPHLAQKIGADVRACDAQQAVQSVMPLAHQR